MTTPDTNPGTEPGRRFYRLRAPDPDTGSTAVTVRVTDGEDLYVAVGAGRRRMYLTEAEAWALWRGPSATGAPTGTTPDWVPVPAPPQSRRPPRAQRGNPPH